MEGEFSFGTRNQADFSKYFILIFVYEGFILVPHFHEHCYKLKRKITVKILTYDVFAFPAHVEFHSGFVQVTLPLQLVKKKYPKVYF